VPPPLEAPLETPLPELAAATELLAPLPPLDAAAAEVLLADVDDAAEVPVVPSPPEVEDVEVTPPVVPPVVPPSVVPQASCRRNPLPSTRIL
jgi:hypothetical protein